MVKISSVRRLLLSELSDSPNNRFIADCILKEITGLSQAEILLGEAEISSQQATKCRRIASDYLLGEPLQYLFGHWEFYGLDFEVGKGVLIPRADTETLCEKAILELPKGSVVADLCAGSGCIGITLSVYRPDITVYMIEKSKEAFKYLIKNTERYKNTSLFPIKGDITDFKLINSLPKLDAILSNPPYLTKTDMMQIPKDVAKEPKEALYGGEDGLDFYRLIPLLWKDKLKDGGLMYMEIGATQSQDVCRIFENEGYCVRDVFTDIEKRPRVVAAEKKGK